MSHKSSLSPEEKMSSVSDNMVERLRRKISAKSVVGTVLLLMIASVFVFFGLPTSRYGGTVGSVAEINGQFISVADFQQEENRIMEQYSQYFKGQDMGPMRKMLKGQALSNLVTLEVVSQGAKTEEIYTTPIEIRDIIVNEIPVFQENGRFKRDRYQQYLDGTRTTAGEFEKKIEKSLQNMRLRRLFEAAYEPSVVELESESRAGGFSVKLAFIKIEKKKTTTHAATTPEEAEKAEKQATEAYQAELKNLENLLTQKNWTQVEGHIKGSGQKWKEVEGNLQGMHFGELPTSVAEVALTQVKKTGEIYGQLVKEGADQYLVKLVSVNNSVKPIEEQAKESLARKYASTVFENWVLDVKKKSKITENKQVIEM